MDDTTVPLLARGGTKTARLWTYVRDDRPFAGGAPPAALFYFSRDREMAHALAPSRASKLSSAGWAMVTSLGNAMCLGVIAAISIAVFK